MDFRERLPSRRFGESAFGRCTRLPWVTTSRYRLTQDLVPTEGEAEIAEQRVPNLEELDEQEAHRFLAEFFPA